MSRSKLRAVPCAGTALRAVVVLGLDADYVAAEKSVMRMKSDDASGQLQANPRAKVLISHVSLLG